MTMMVMMTTTMILTKEYDSKFDKAGSCCNSKYNESKKTRTKESPALGGWSVLCPSWPSASAVRLVPQVQEIVRWSVCGSGRYRRKVHTGRYRREWKRAYLRAGNVRHPKAVPDHRVVTAPNIPILHTTPPQLTLP